jgi:hypothetical protein
MPPCGFRCAKIDEDVLPNIRPISLNPSPRCQRSQTSALSLAVNTRRSRLFTITPHLSSGKVLRRPTESTTHNGRSASVCFRPIADIQQDSSVREWLNSLWEERAETELRQTMDDLLARLEAISLAEMILACRRVLDLWIKMDGSSLDDPVIGFLGIESQTDHVLGPGEFNSARDGDGVRFARGSPEEAAEIENCGHWFLDGFRQSVVELAEHLNRTR